MDDPCRRMYAIVDECLGAEKVRQILEPRGHTVTGAGTAFPRGSPDPPILAFVSQNDAVLLTTDNDYKTLGTRVPGQRARFRRAHRVVFVSCEGPKALRRLEELIDDIEREYRFHCERGRRMTMWITGGNFRVER